MNVFKFVFGHRGAGNLVRRTGQIVTRFGVTPSRMGGRFERFMDVLDDYGVRPTFPITALPMSRHPAFAHRLLERGAELAVHAWSHVDLTTLDYEGQLEHLGNAIRLFREHDVPFSGFRAPYLHWNDDTMRVVEAYRFRYSSNQTLWWDVIDREGLDARALEGLERGMAFYRPVPATRMRALPVRRRGFVEIPVCLPDDEIPLDRMYVHDADFLERMWTAILDETWRRGELFTLQLHPERIDFFTGALRAVVESARSRRPPVWIATLDEIARWWVERSTHRVECVREGEGFRVTVTAGEGTTVIVREDGAERTVDPGTFVVRGSARPVVGVGPQSEREAVQALEDLGYVVETATDPAAFAVFLGDVRGDDRERIDACVERIAAAPGPMVRLGVWPRGHRSALAITGDIDALTLQDFAARLRGR